MQISAPLNYDTRTNNSDVVENPLQTSNGCEMIKVFTKRERYRIILELWKLSRNKM